MKGLEPEIQRLIAKHKSDMNKVKQIHEAELLEADERAAQKYVKMTEELRDQLATEKEAACAREREMSKQRYTHSHVACSLPIVCLLFPLSLFSLSPASTCPCIIPDITEGILP